MGAGRGLIATAAAALAIGIGTPFRPTVVMGHSMMPAMQPGSLHVIDTRYYRSHPIQRGDVIVFRYQGATCTKRVSALPGDPVLLIQDEDGGPDEIVEARQEAAICRLAREGRFAHRRLRRLIVPPGFCFVLGDNQAVSWDSREFGCLPFETILGRVQF
jgi:signal peptidase I